MELGEFQRTKIVATVGPACQGYNKLLELAKAGVDVFRLNFSHGTIEDHQKTIHDIKYINEKYNSHLAILADLQGPKLRVGKMKDEGIEIKEGDILTFTNEECIGTLEKVYMSYLNFAEDVEVGEKVLVDDGKIELEVVETDKDSIVKLKVLFGGVLKSNKGVNLPQTKISLPCLTPKDLRDLEFVLTQNVNWIALSFVRSAADIRELRGKIDAAGHLAKIIAKIEKPEAVIDLENIINETDAVMVARGDLGIEVPMERLPIVQKQIIRLCLKMAKPVIVATQMMESMITNPSPTRAEINDVANAVMDGTDAVMLSGETSVGKHPAKVIEAVLKIIAEVEALDEIYYIDNSPQKDSVTFLSDAICYNACRIANSVNAKIIVGMTKSGYTGFKVSSGRPKAGIIIFSDERVILSTLNLVWGIRGFYYDKFTTTDETISDVQEILVNAGVIKKGDIVINTGSMPLKARHRTNMVKVSVI